MEIYDMNVIIKGLIYPYNEKYHKEQLEKGEVYSFSECIKILNSRRG